MKKRLILLGFALLPLGAFALLENATVKAEVLPYASDAWLTTQEQTRAELETHIAAQLAKVPDLSGMYAGIISVEVADKAEVLFFRMASLREGRNAFWVADDKGVLAVDVTLKPEGAHWGYQGSVEYREYVAPERVFGFNTTLSLAEGLTIVGGLSANQRRQIAAGKGLASANAAAPQERAADTLTGIIFLRTADTPAPQGSAANPIHPVQLPSGRVVQPAPALSPEAARKVLAAAFATDAAAPVSANPVD